MYFLIDALKISSEKVFVSIINILVFRFIYDQVRNRITTGFFAFFITIYVSGQARSFIFNSIKSIKKKFINSKKSNHIDDFKPSNLSSSEIELNDLKRIISNYGLEFKCQRDLFSFIFNSSTNSSLLNLIIMISIELIHSKYGIDIPTSILYCISVAFVVMFGSSYRYSTVTSQECLEFFQNKKLSHIAKFVPVYYNRGEELNKELVCVWTCLNESKDDSYKIELKFMSSVYSAFQKDIFDFYAINHLKLVKPDKKPTNEADENQIIQEEEEDFKIENYTLAIPDYYDTGLIFSNAVKKLGFKLVTSWTEFIFLPGISFKLSTFTNILMQDDKNKKLN